MKLSLALALAVVAAAAVTARGSDDDPHAHVLIPLTPVAQTHSTAMTARLDDLRKHDVFTTLEQRTRLAELPRWVLDPNAREIAFIIPSPLTPDAFRYGVILGTNGDVIVIRTGGLQDCYEVYVIEGAGSG